MPSTARSLSRTLPTLLVFLGAIAIATWLLVGEDAPGDLEDLSSEARDTPSLLTDGRPEVDAEVLSSDDSEVAARRALDAPLANETIGNSDANAVLQLVEQGSGAVVAGATVHFADLPSQRVTDLFTDVGALGDAVDWLQQEGVELTSDATGRIQLPAHDERAVVVARRGALFGVWRQPSRTDEPWTLTMRPDHALRVHVVDEDGSPIPDLELALRTKDDSRSRVFERVTTDAQGWAQLPHADWILASRNVSTLFVAPEALLLEPVHIRWEADDAGEPLELVLPRVGRVQAAITTVLGEAWRFSSTKPWNDPSVRLYFASSGAGTERGPDDGGLSLKRRNAALPWGWVQCGQEVEAVCDPTGFEHQIRAVAAGPVAAFETVEIELVIGADHPLVRLRAVDGSGHPWPDADLRLSIQEFDGFGSSRSRRSDCRTDGDGVVLVPIVAARDGFRMRLRVTLEESTDDYADEPRPELAAALDLPTDVDAGLLDLGDVTLAEPPIVASGVVLDANDVPVPGALVVAELAWPDALRPVGNAASAFGGSDEPPSAEQLEQQRDLLERDRASMRFMLMPSLRLVCDADGRFEVRTAEPLEALRLSAKHADGPPGEPIEVTPGTLDLVLRVERRTVVTGRVLFPDGVGREDVAVSLEYVHDPSKPPVMAAQPRPKLDADGEWRLEGVRPGTWNVFVRDASAFGWEGLAEPTRTQVVGGTETRVPDVDLRLVLRCFHIEVVDEFGAPVPAATGTFSGTGSHENNDIVVEDGRARILTPHAELLAWIGAPGRRTVRIENLSDGDRVVLPPALVVEVQLDDVGAVPPAPLELVAYLTPGRGQTNWVLGTITTGQEFTFDAVGRVTLGAAVTGAQDLKIGLRDPGARRSNGSVPTHWLDDDGWERVVVEESATPLRMTIALDPDAVLDAIEALRASDGSGD